MAGIGIKGFLRRWLPLIVWIMAIFGLSSIPELPGEQFDLPVGFDKIAHFFEYMVLAFCLIRGLSYGNSGRMVMLVGVTTLIGVGIAACDELYQSYIPGRDSSITDLAADVMGIAAGITIIALRRRKRFEGD